MASFEFVLTTPRELVDPLFSAAGGATPRSGRSNDYRLSVPEERSAWEQEVSHCSRKQSLPKPPRRLDFIIFIPVSTGLPVH